MLARRDVLKIGAVTLGRYARAAEPVLAQATQTPTAGLPHPGRATGASMGPLRVHPLNPRYFRDGSGQAVYLTGSHTWATLQERGYAGTTPNFDYPAYLAFLQTFQHNCMRLWAWEHAAWMQFTDQKMRYTPLPFVRSGPGTALDGGLKFDLSRFHLPYFDRLRARVRAARDRGIYVVVMLFQGFSIEQKGTPGVDHSKGNPWDGHLFHRHNNINGIDGDPNGDGEGHEVHTLALPAITARQKAYVSKVIDTLNDLDNVLWEISNESHGGSREWQYHMINYVKSYEARKPYQHPVGMTVAWPEGSNAALFGSAADWISPNATGGYKENPPAADGHKVILNDTDHLWGVGGNRAWVWKSFLRGLNPLFMDPYKDVRFGGTYDPRWDEVRRAMGHTLTYADQMPLAAMTPQNSVASTQYCLARPGAAYLIYQPLSNTALTVQLQAKTYHYEWFNPSTGEIASTGTITVNSGGTSFRAPFSGDAILYLVAT